MIRKTVTYKDLDGKEKKEDLYFHLYGMQLTKLEGSQKGGLRAVFADMLTASKDGDSEGAMKMIRKLFRLSYGIRDDDGKFHHTKALAKAFMSSLACDALLVSLMDGTGKAASDFFIGILPEGMISQAEIVQASQPNTQGMRSIDDSPADQPPWIRENRDPTPKEAREMTHEQLIEAWKARNARETSQEKHAL
jgi:hypothetical protein